MNGAIAKAVMVLGLVGGIFWGFSALVDQVGRDVADLKRQAAALSMASDADQAERIGADLAQR